GAQRCDQRSDGAPRRRGQELVDAVGDDVFGGGDRGARRREALTGKPAHVTHVEQHDVVDVAGRRCDVARHREVDEQQPATVAIDGRGSVAPMPSAARERRATEVALRNAALSVGPIAPATRASLAAARSWPNTSVSPMTGESRPAATRNRCESAWSPWKAKPC